MIRSETSEARGPEEQIRQNTVQCAGCGAFGSSKDRFCACCGDPLHRVCPSCRASIIQPVAFFCTQCGTRLTDSHKTTER